MASKTKRAGEGFLSRGAMTAAAVKKWLLLLIGGVLTAFFGLGLLLIVTGEIERSNLGVCLGVLVPSVLLLVLGIRQAKRMDLARRYNSVFLSVEGGTADLEELVDQIGKSQGQVLQELEQLFAKGFFRDCTLRRGSRAAVLLPASEAGGRSFVSVVCPNCGATSTLPAGGRGRCEYCGGSLAAEE